MNFKFAKLADRVLRGTARVGAAAMQNHIRPAAEKLDGLIERSRPHIQAGAARAAELAAEGARRLGHLAERVASDLRAKAESASYVEVPTDSSHSKGLLASSVEPATQPKRLYIQICTFDDCYAQALKGGTLCAFHALKTAAGALISSQVNPSCLWHSCNNNSATGSMYCRYHFAEHEAFRQRHCGKKIKHHNKDSAVQHASALANKEGAAFAAYQCKVCDAFHVGHHRENSFQN
jgi:hypothetical protein